MQRTKTLDTASEMFADDVGSNGNFHFSHKTAKMSDLEVISLAARDTVLPAVGPVQAQAQLHKDLLDSADG